MRIKTKQSYPLVSVVIPVYNGEKYLKKTIESVLNQNYQNFEVVVVDDASTDSSLEIINSFIKIHPQKIRLIQHSKNKGCPAATKNTGIKNAKGKYIAFIDQDDIWKKEKLTKQIEIIIKKKDLIANFANGYILNSENSKIIARQWPHINQFPNQKEIQQRLLKGNFILTSSCALVKKDSLIQLGGFDEQMKLADDYDLWFRLSLIGNLSFINLPLFYWRYHKSSLSHNEEKHLKDLIYFYNKNLSLINCYNLDKKIITYYLAIYTTRLANFYLANKKTKRAQELYKQSLNYFPNQWAVKFMLKFSKIFPQLAALIIRIKRFIAQHYSWMRLKINNQKIL